ncbi:MAG: hypothetical protein MSH08_03875 [Ezakiella sp.]|nr:hypothetical protein [Ezakiella sp.]MDD7471660.1 hypothetical protein [Bacillota bacterium]MDY3923444.1 hypothetical protein [Ezakiella sp.]
MRLGQKNNKTFIILCVLLFLAGFAIGVLIHENNKGSLNKFDIYVHDEKIESGNYLERFSKNEQFRLREKYILIDEEGYKNDFFNKYLKDIVKNEIGKIDESVNKECYITYLTLHFNKDAAYTLPIKVRQK